MAQQTQTVGAAPKLLRRAEFETALEDYRISDEGLEVLRTTQLVVLVGPTAGGRNTVIHEVLQSGNYYFIVSDTTRPPRVNDGKLEQNGVEYFFRSEAEVLADIKAGLFVEAEVIHSQQVSGISIREIRKARDQGKIAITDVEILGGVNIASLKSDAIVVYLVPPSFEEWLRRLQGRTPLSADELRNRLNGAIKNFSIALQQDNFIFIVNDKKEDTARIVDEQVRLGPHRGKHNEAARELVRTLYAKTQEYLTQL